MGLAASSIQAAPATGPWYQPQPEDQSPLVMAHQGGEGEYPSNSMLAFTKAAEAGADVLDTDMFATSDGELVLFHDETLEHRTDCSGPISDKTYNELLQCDFAYHWSSDGGATFPYRGQGIQVVKAEELLDAFPSARIGLEIKQTTAQSATDLCNLIKAKNAEDRMLISSFTQANMDVFRAACPSVATSATQDEGTQFYLYTQSSFPSDFNPPYSSLQVPEFFSGIQVVTPDTVADAHSFGLKVYVWTIDETDDAQRLKDLGVDGLNSSFPRRIIEYLPPPFLPHHNTITIQSPNGCNVSYTHGNYSTTSYARARYDAASGGCDAQQSYVEIFSWTGSGYAVQRCYLLNATPEPGGQGGCSSYGSPLPWAQAAVTSTSIISSRAYLCDDTGQSCTTHAFAGFPM